MRLTEDNDLSFNQRFKEAKNPSDVLPIIQEFCNMQGFPNYNKEEWDTFINNNLNSIYIECNKYGLSMDNPFFQFLHRYSQQNGTIKPFLDRNNYDLLHNCVSNRILDKKQLSFKCSEEQQVRILLNPHLWDTASKPDLLYLIKVYNWVLSEDLNRYIINKSVRAALSDNLERVDDKLKYDEPDFNDKKSEIMLLKTLFCTKLINELEFKDVITVNNSIKSMVENNGMLVSSPIMPADIVEQQIASLSERVQESRRGPNGKFQKGTNQKGGGERGAERFSPNEKANILSKADKIKKSIISTYKINSAQDLRDILELFKDSWSSI